VTAISVCIATYNGERYIQEQLDSILSQLEDNDEIIISDDGSTDKTVEIIRSYTDKRIKLFHHRRNKQILSMPVTSLHLAAKNFENAINQSQGNYIYLADQDDIWFPNRIKKTQPLLEYYDLVMCNYMVIDDKGIILINKVYNKNPVSKRFFKNLKTSPFSGCCMAFRRGVLDYCLPFPKNCIVHDFWMGCLIVHLGSFKYIEEPLHLLRRHPRNISCTTEKSTNPLWFKIAYRLHFMYLFFMNIIKYKLKSV
jgi:glycosyltransferase involved in cell wall biosynthesis